LQPASLLSATGLTLRRSQPIQTQGKSAALARKIVDDARALQKPARSILLEMVPDRLCQLITERAKDCIIMSLGSGPRHGQLLILPRYVRPIAPGPAVFGNAGEVILNGLKQYHDEVIAGSSRREKLVRHAGRRIR
jgi:ketopantoate hydroxymethyltransferase